MTENTGLTVDCQLASLCETGYPQRFRLHRPGSEAMIIVLGSEAQGFVQ